MKYTQDLDYPNFDRLFSYDFANRLTKARTGVEAREQTAQDPTDIPFREDFEHNTFGQLTNRTGEWRPGTSCEDDMDDNELLYVNNRKTGSGFQHDSDGRLTYAEGIVSQFDSKGDMVERWRTASFRLGFDYDVNGQEVKRTEEIWDSELEEWDPAESNYYIRSTVLGGKVVSEIAQNGQKTRSFIYAGDEVIARQELDDESDEDVVWIHWDPSRNSRFLTDENGDAHFEPNETRVEIDPLGNNANFACFPPVPDRGFGTLNFMRTTVRAVPENFLSYGKMCYFDGVPMFCESANSLASQMGEGIDWSRSGFLPPGSFSDMSGRLEAASIGEMVDTLRIERLEDDNSVLISSGGDSSYAWVTVSAGSPVYRLVSGSSSLAGPIDDPCKEGGDFLKCLDYILREGRCATRLRDIFGGPDTFMATRWEPPVLRPLFTGETEERRAEWLDREGRGPGENPKFGVVHLFSNFDGVGGSTENAFTPSGWSNAVAGQGPNSDGEEQNFIRFYYSPGALSKYGYEGGLTVNFTHIGPTQGRGVPVIPDSNGPTNGEGSVLVGSLGAYGSPMEEILLTGGSRDGYYVHSHMIFNTWDGKSEKVSRATRIDPRKVFCKDLGF